MNSPPNTLLLFVFMWSALGQNETNNTVINLAVIYDTDVYDWSPDIIDATVSFINEGMWDVLPSKSTHRVEYHLENSKCDPTTAVRAWWKLRTANGGKPLDGLIGARCSGASISLATISGLEHVPHLSPVSDSAALSNDEEFPFFSRLLAPSDEEVRATIALLREFGWSIVTILGADTTYSEDWVNSFRKAWVGDHNGAWKGSVAYSDTFRLRPDGGMDPESIRQTLRGIPSGPGSSRVILFPVHSQHAHAVLEETAKINFRPDAIWVGSSDWIPSEIQQDWNIGRVPGYIGAAPFLNRDEVYNEFLKKLNDWQSARGKVETKDLPLFARESVDAIRAMVQALVNSNNRSDGRNVVTHLRQLEFDGVSGHVEFDDIGDRKNPLYTISNAHSVSDSGLIQWNDIGFVGTDIRSVTIYDKFESICFAEVGCKNLKDVPPDTYPELPSPTPIWRSVVIATSIVAVLGVCFALRSGHKNKKAKKELEALRATVTGTRTAESDCIPRIKPIDLEDQALRRGSSQNIDVGSAQQESEELHVANNISFSQIDVPDVAVGDILPEDLKGEAQMVLVKGDVIQISKSRPYDEWRFGTKVYAVDEEKARELVAVACDGMDPDTANVFHDSGWFQLSNTRMPTAEDLQFIKDNIGNATLALPSTWTKIIDPCVAERHQLPAGEEWDLVKSAFLEHMDSTRTQIVSVERVQNLAMWQSYDVKLKTICHRELKSNPPYEEAQLAQFERKLLFHGTNKEVVDKIIQQGFNRSYCGKNATMYGKGVYFAKKSKYSAKPIYAAKDRDGCQYIIACRVAVGKFCRGKEDLLTAPERDRATHLLFDSTVDKMDDPTIYVTYHDAQAYPEYIIKFKRSNIC